jgi:hypothetical protein
MGGYCSKDMAICLVIFNPARTRKIIQNYHEMRNALGSLPVFTIELVYPNREPEISDALHVFGNSIMFHKENLCRILEKNIPKKYTKLAFLDADILFEEGWYSKGSAALDNYDVVQLFDKCQWLDSDGEVILERESVLNMTEKKWNSKYHPGFAWGFKRDWYNKVGFFDYAVSGSGDTLSAIKWLQKDVPAFFKSLPRPLVAAYSEFCPSPPKISRLDGTVKHLWHGTRENRKYVERHQMLDINADIRDLLDTKGVFEWKDKEMSKRFLNYFISRNDDDDKEVPTS